MKRGVWLAVLLVLASRLAAIEVLSVSLFLKDAILESWHPGTDEVLFSRHDTNGILQLYIVRADALDPETEKRCLSCEPAPAVGMDGNLIPWVHKGAADWHPSADWFIIQVEIPDNISWYIERFLPDLRLLAEPGAGWWNNLFLVRRDGRLWTRLTDFKPWDLDSGVLYPKFSRDGGSVAWGERVGGADPYDKYPFAQWVLNSARLDLNAASPRLTDIRRHDILDGAIYEPQDWNNAARVLVAADIGHGDLPYPGYRIDVWEFAAGSGGSLAPVRNLTHSPDFYEEQSSYSPDGRFVTFMANLFDAGYGQRLAAAWQKYGSGSNSFITTDLKTDLYLMDKDGGNIQRLTTFADTDVFGSHALATRSAWSADGRTILMSLTYRSNATGKITGRAIFRIRSAY